MNQSDTSDLKLRYAQIGFIFALGIMAGLFVLWQGLMGAWGGVAIATGFFLLLMSSFLIYREWRDGHKIRVSEGFQDRIEALQKRLNAQDDFFHLIFDSTPSTLAIFTNKNEYWFLNASAAQAIGVSENEAIGKTPVDIIGLERGRKIERHMDQVRQSNDVLETLDHYTDAKGRLTCMQMRYHPLAPFGEFPGGVMARGENVTSIVIEKERQEGMLRQVIATLVAVVDRRDPYAAGHSARVGQLSRILAVELRLASREVEAAEIAGSLMNFGKVLVSRSILTKIDALSQDELQRIRDGILTSADILSMIDFAAPVVPTLRQVLERYDGAGVPMGLKEDAIMVTARIVAVANAFVAMVSPRAYRPGIDVKTACGRLKNDAGRAFDPAVINSLENYVMKNSDKLDWLTVSKGF